MMASLRESVGTGTKVDELNTGRVWAVGFHHITVHSRFISLIFQILSGRGKLRVTETADTESANTGVRMCVCVCVCVCVYIYIYI